MDLTDLWVARDVLNVCLALQLAWAVTVHNSQGLTLGRINFGLRSREFSTGLTFVPLSDLSGIKASDRIQL